MVWGAIIAGVAAGLIPAIVYWQESPLRAARQEAAAGEPRIALSRVSYFLAGHPEHGEALALKARLLVELGRPEEAVAIFEEVGATTVDDLHAWALAYLRQGRLNYAMPILAQVVEREPTRVDSLHELTAVRIRLGLLEEASQSARRLAAIPGEEGHGHLFLAAIQNDLGDHAASAAEYRQVLEYSPDGSRLPLSIDEVLRQYGTVLYTLGQHERAVEILERSITVRPQTVTYLNLGSALSQLGRTEEARNAWKTALEFSPNDPSAHEFLANAALEQKDAEEALKWLKPLAVRPDLRSSTAYAFQRAYVLLKDEPAAETWKEKTTKLREAEQRESTIDQMLVNMPKSYWSNVLRAYRFALAGNWAQAGDMLVPLAAEEPLDPFVRDLAEAVRRRGELPSLTRVPMRNR